VKKCYELTVSVLKLHFLLFRKTINAGVTSSLEEEVETWRKLYEDLKNKTKPFQVCDAADVCLCLLASDWCRWLRFCS